MAPRKAKAKKAKVTLSLADFNPDAVVGTPVELASLPSAPKQAEEWEAVGGRPEYNSRGFKERTVTHDYDANALVASDEAFAQRDWVRGANLQADAEGGGGDGGGGAGAGGVERSWDSMRRGGPLDAEEGEAERDFGMMRRGPVESQFDEERGREKDFGAARGGMGPVEADFGNGGGEPRDFGAARGGAGPVEADFKDGGGDEQRDFRAARGGMGPVDADFEDSGVERDFSAARIGPGPVEAEFGGAEKEVDFGKRTGPVEAEFPGAKDVDFGKRTGPVDADFGNNAREVDFAGARSGATFDAEFAGGEEEVDFGSARKGAMAKGVKLPSGGRNVDFSVRSGPIEGTGASREDGASREGGEQWGRQSRTVEGGREQGAGGGDELDWSARRKAPTSSLPGGRSKDRSGGEEMDFGAARNRSGGRDLASAAAPDRASGPSGASAEPINTEPSAAHGGGAKTAQPAKERDWGRARNMQRQPVVLRAKVASGNGERGEQHGSGRAAGLANGMTRPSPAEDAAEAGPAHDSPADDGDWTTVHAPARSRGRGGFVRGKRGGRGRGAPLGGHAEARPAAAVSGPATAEPAATE